MHAELVDYVQTARKCILNIVWPFAYSLPWEYTETTDWTLQVSQKCCIYRSVRIQISQNPYCIYRSVEPILHLQISQNPYCIYR